MDRLYAAHDLVRERLKRSAEHAKRNYYPTVRPWGSGLVSKPERQATLAQVGQDIWETV